MIMSPNSKQESTAYQGGGRWPLAKVIEGPKYTTFKFSFVSNDPTEIVSLWDAKIELKMSQFLNSLESPTV